MRIERLRSLGGQVCIFERIVLPRSLFPAIEKRALPNNLYELYRSDFGVTMVRASEKLKAVAAGKREAKHLGFAPGAPLLSIDRTRDRRRRAAGGMARLAVPHRHARITGRT